MTIRDPEVLEALRDEPELLALADALQSTAIPAPAAAPARRRIPVVRLAVVGAAAIAAVVLLLVSPWSGGPSLTDRALAAIGSRPVLHVVVRYTFGERIELRTGRVAPLRREGELWYDPALHVYRSVARADGQVVHRSSGTGDLSTTEPFVFTTLFRRALAAGKLHAVGRGVIDGQDVIFVQAGGGNENRMRAALDAKSYRLVRLQIYAQGRLASQLDVLRFETVERSQAHLPAPKPGPVPSVAGTSVSGGSDYRPLSLSRARTVFATAPVWAGRVVDGHRLETIQREDVTDTSGGVTVRGRRLTFGYGPGGELGSEPFLQVEEGPASSPTWRVEIVYPPPPGYVDVTSGQEGTGPGHMHTQWTGVMQVHGLVVQLTSLSEQTLLAAARALRPLP